MAAGFTISKFVVVQSLEPFEVQTGQLLYELLRGLTHEFEPALDVVLYNCNSAAEFRAMLARLAREARDTGERPLLHIECHGSPTEGLEFENGSTLGWEECGELFTHLNVATRFNLIVAVAACFGVYLNGQYSPVKPSPAYCILAPTDTIDPAEAMSGFRNFYTSLIRTGDAGPAIRALSKTPVSSGQWFSQLAENWFVDLVENYVKTRLNKNDFDIWARSLSRRIRDSGTPSSVGAMKRQLLRQNREGIAGKYFDCFFCTSQLPECVSRFATTRERIIKNMEALRATGQYRI